MTSTYALAPAVRGRLLGSLLVLGGALVALVSALVWLWDVPAGLLTGTVLLVVAAVLGAAVFLVRARPLVALDEAGYRVRFLRGAGAKHARWREVEDMVTASVAGDDCVVLRLRDGRTTAIPVAVIDAPRDDFVRDLAAHLDRGHGYRRI